MNLFVSRIDLEWLSMSRTQSWAQTIWFNLTGPMKTTTSVTQCKRNWIRITATKEKPKFKTVTGYLILIKKKSPKKKLFRPSNSSTLDTEVNHAILPTESSALDIEVDHPILPDRKQIKRSVFAKAMVDLKLYMRWNHHLYNTKEKGTNRPEERVCSWKLCPRKEDAAFYIWECLHIFTP